MIITSGEMKLEEAPVRSCIRRRRQNFIVDFPSFKNGRSMRCESVLESAYCIWLEYDPEVMKYYTQPHTFTWVDNNESHRYTPDFLVVLKQGLNYFSEIKHDFSKQRPRLLEKLDSFNVLCIKEGWTFQRHDQHSITNSTKFETLKALYSRMRPCSELQQMYFYHYIQQREWPTTLGDLLQDSAAPNAATICFKLFTGELVADLNQRLTLDLLINGTAHHD